MKAFRFKLQKLLEIRQKEEEDIKNEMAVYIQDYNRVISNIDKFNRTMQEYNNRRIELLKDALGIQMYTDNMRFYRSNIKSLETEREQKEEVVNSWRSKLLEAVKRRKAIEYIKDKALKKYKLEQKREESKFIDEIANRKNSLEMLF